MNEIKKGWKVIRGSKRESTFVSTVSWGTKVKVKYPLGKWTKRGKGNGPLAVFTNMKDAVRFSLCQDYVKVVPCEYVPAEEHTFWFKDFKGSLKCNLGITGMLPRGTTFADAVKCLE